MAKALGRKEIAADKKVRAPPFFTCPAAYSSGTVQAMPNPDRKLPIPPYNPGLRDLVEGKRAWDPRASKARQREGFRGWNERGYLPHPDSPGLTRLSQKLLGRCW
jgi:hypothetical protein